VTNLVQFFQSVGQSFSQSVSQVGSQEIISVVRSRFYDHEDSRVKYVAGFVTQVLIDLIRWQILLYKFTVIIIWNDVKKLNLAYDKIRLMKFDTNKKR